MHARAATAGSTTASLPAAPAPPSARIRPASSPRMPQSVVRPPRQARLEAAPEQAPASGGRSFHRRTRAMPKPDPGSSHGRILVEPPVLDDARPGSRAAASPTVTPHPAQTTASISTAVSALMASPTVPARTPAAGGSVQRRTPHQDDESRQRQGVRSGQQRMNAPPDGRAPACRAYIRSSARLLAGDPAARSRRQPKAPRGGPAGPVPDGAGARFFVQPCQRLAAPSGYMRYRIPPSDPSTKAATGIPRRSNCRARAMSSTTSVRTAGVAAGGEVVGSRARRWPARTRPARATDGRTSAAAAVAPFPPSAPRRCRRRRAVRRAARPGGSAGRSPCRRSPPPPRPGGPRSPGRARCRRPENERLAAAGPSALPASPGLAGPARRG